MTMVRMAASYAKFVRANHQPSLENAPWLVQKFPWSVQPQKRGGVFRFINRDAVYHFFKGI